MNSIPLFSELRSMPDPLLLEQALASATREREETARVLAHLAEIERRKLHLQRGYSSLFTYAREALKYSESGAARRVAAARLILEFPERLEAIAQGRLTLTAAMEAWRTFSELRKPERPAAVSEPVQPSILPRSDVAPVPKPLTQEAKREVLDTLENRSRTEVSHILQEMRHAARGTTPEASSERPRGRVEPHSKHWEKLELYLSPDERARFDRLRELLSHAHPSSDPTAVFLRLIEEGLEKHDPIRQEARAARRAEKKAELQRKVPVKSATRASTTTAADAETGVERHCRGDSEPQRPVRPVPAFPGFGRVPIPRTLRRQLRLRDLDGCQHEDPESKRRCGSTRFLDIDHVRPVSEGGANELANLRLMCASHNRHRMKWEARSA